MSQPALPLPDLLQRYLIALREAGVGAVFQDWSSFTPASEAQLAALAAEAGAPLPEELVVWLTTVANELPFVGNYSAQKPGQISERIRGTREIDFSRHFENISSWGDGRFDDARLARTYWQPQWVPLAADGCGNEYCYDLKPGPAGRVGQIIAMEFQDGQGPYLAQWRSLEHMLRDHLERLQAGAFTLDDEGFIEFAFE